ncbi:hypothetical protein RHMOL_Rhmol09G0193800 [Rhododendron molle]|uniref:Uncharacterized protein n=1 Tax=Rhododendron molle TaxID=49168 RepID=A0ACC0MFP1_RHOML|nr:hypothetical protein RHMOL_Rhmol09G0193800 [Rhododendron molle]
MEPSESGLSSYYHHHPPQQNQQPQPPPPQQSPTSASPAAVIASPTNGTLPPHTSTVTPTSEGGKRKRGRPRKYATPEEAAAARKALLASSIPKKKKKDKFVGGGSGGGGGDPSSFSVSYSKKTPVAPPGVGNVGQGFTPNTLNVAAGEDVYQKIMLFMQQSKSEICILSASGSISNPSLRQPATFGGNITYEGRFDILSLSGSYIHTELGGRSGGLSVCLSSTDGQIIGGGIGGPLKAAGPVQVIVGTFVIDATGGMKGDASFPKFQSPVGGSSVSSRACVSNSSSFSGNSVFQIALTNVCAWESVCCTGLAVGLGIIAFMLPADLIDKGHLLTRTRKLVKGLAMAEPVWLKAMEQAPPVSFPRADGKVKQMTLPEDVYVKKFFQKHTDSKYEDSINFCGFDPTPAREFGCRVLDLKEQGVGEEEAMAVADMEYRAGKKAKKKAYARLKQIARLQGKRPPPNPYPSAIKAIQAEERPFVRARFFDQKILQIVEKMKEERAAEMQDRMGGRMP